MWQQPANLAFRLLQSWPLSPKYLLRPVPHPVPRLGVSPAKPRPVQAAIGFEQPLQGHDDLMLVVPEAPTDVDQSGESTPVVGIEPEAAVVPDAIFQPEELLPGTPQLLKVYEDPFRGDDATPKPTFAGPVLEDKPINEDAAGLQRIDAENGIASDVPSSPEKSSKTRGSWTAVSQK